MIVDARDNDLGPLSIVVVDMGNTTTRVGRWVEGDVLDVASTTTGDQAALVDVLVAARAQCENQERQAIVIASVAPVASDALAAHIEDDLNLRAFVVGGNTPLPVETTLQDSAAVGADRVCCAAAAFARTEHACTVVDVGSAVTVDVIDDEGIFQGGAILPGLRMQARALADYTAQLPMVDPVDSGAVASAIGKSTEEAIAGGLIYGMVGAIRGIVEQVATQNQQWHQTILTGGGAELLKDHMDFVDSWVPDLCLMGVGLAYMRRVEQAQSGLD